MSHLLRKLHTPHATLVLGALTIAACGSDSMAHRSHGTAAACSGHIVAAPTVTDLGTLGGLTSGATGVNDQGVVVGASLVSCLTCTPQQTPSHAFRFQSGQLTDLGTLGGKSSAAKAINNNDWIVGWAHTTGNASHAALWKPGSAAQDLGTMGGSTSIAWGINKKNQIVGQSDVPSPGRFHAFLWQNGTFTDLGLLPGGDWSVAQAINDSGLIVGQASPPAAAITAVLWRKGTHTIRDLGVLPGTGSATRFSVAYGVNNSGRIVGSSDVPRGGRPVCRGVAGVMQDLGTPSGGFSTSFAEAFGINDAGQIVGSGVSFTGLNQ